MKVRSYFKRAIFAFFISTQSFACECEPKAEYIDGQYKQRLLRFNAQQEEKDFVEYTENTNKLLSAYDGVSDVPATPDQKKSTIKMTIAKFFVHADPQKYKLTFKKLKETDKNYRHFKVLELTETLSYALITHNGIKPIDCDILSTYWDDCKDLYSFSKITQEMFTLWFNEALTDHNQGLTKDLTVCAFGKPSPLHVSPPPEVICVAPISQTDQHVPDQRQSNEENAVTPTDTFASTAPQHLIQNIFTRFAEGDIDTGSLCEQFSPISFNVLDTCTTNDSIKTTPERFSYPTLQPDDSLTTTPSIFFKSEKKSVVGAPVMMAGGKEGSGLSSAVTTVEFSNEKEPDDDGFILLSPIKENDYIHLSPGKENDYNTDTEGKEQGNDDGQDKDEWDNDDSDYQAPLSSAEGKEQGNNDGQDADEWDNDDSEYPSYNQTPPFNKPIKDKSIKHYTSAIAVTLHSLLPLR